MALTLTTSVCLKNKCLDLSFKDTTGVYNATTNTGGWEDATATVLAAEVSTVTLKITFPDATTQTETLTSQFPTGSTYTGTITYNNIRTTAGSAYPDGLYTLLYTVVSTGGTNPGTYKKKISVYISCNSEAYVTGLWAAYASAVCASSCDLQLKLEKAQMAEGLLSALKASAACSNTAAADKLVIRIKRLADYEDCGC